MLSGYRFGMAIGGGGGAQIKTTDPRSAPPVFYLVRMSLGDLNEQKFA